MLNRSIKIGLERPNCYVMKNQKCRVMKRELAKIVSFISWKKEDIKTGCKKLKKTVAFLWKRYISRRS